MNPQIPKVILIVDDERIITAPLSRLIRRLLKENAQFSPYEIMTANDPVQALAEITAWRHVDSQKELALVISDIMMPQMNGLDFLQETRRLYPNASRVILTGYADKENAIRALNELDLFRFMEKPWDDTQFKQTVVSALRAYEQKKN